MESAGRSLRSRGLLVALIGLGTVVVPLDSAVNIAFPDITRSFGLPIPAIQWLVIGYVLAHASLMLACGRIGDIFGHALVFRAGLALSSAAYLLCGFASEYGWLLAFRVMQGVGAALVVSCGPALVTGLYPEEHRPRLLGLYSMIFGIGSALGPSVGGVLVALWGWPAVFWFRAPLALAALALLRGLPEPGEAGRREPFDAVGAGLLALALSSGLLVLTQIRQATEGDAAPFALAAVSAMLFMAAARQGRRQKTPRVALEAFRNPYFSAANAGNVLANLSGFAVWLLVPYFLVRFTGWPIAACGVILAASALGTIIASPVAGRLAGSLGPHRIMPAGAALLGLGLLMIGSWDTETGLALLIASLLVAGFGLGLFLVAYMDLVAAAIPRRDRGVAGSLGQLTRTIGIVAGAGLLSLAFESLGAAPGGSEAPDEAFLAAFRSTFRLAAGLPLAVALILLLLTRRAPAGGRAS